MVLGLGMVWGWFFGLNFYKLIRGLIVILNVFLFKCQIFSDLFRILKVFFDMVKGFEIVVLLSLDSLEFG